jgi:heptosyltransferase III
MECLRAGCTEVWVAAQNRPLIRFTDAVDSIGGTSLDLVGLPSVEPPPGVITRLRGFDDIVSWYGSNRPEFRAAVAELGLPFRFLTALPDETRGVHAADFYLEQALSLMGRERGEIACPTLWTESVPSNEGFVVIHPFSGSSRKNWPLKRYRELAERLAAQLPVRWCAGPDEPLEGAIRFDDLYELACWISSATVYLGNDSGISHLAAAVGAPVIALFGPTDPRVWGPRGPSVRVVSTRTAGMEMETIEVDQVLLAAGELLSAQTRQRSE